MGAISVLDDELVNKIAAGEVVERPSSVVKELVENSLDANSSSIVVEIKEGGKSLIKVQDNGSGMDHDDAKLSIQRHATSKIKQSEDLFNINTLGFRGEALASIAAVSSVMITTKTKDSMTGMQIVVEGGEIKNEKEVGCPDGTSIEVKELFFNTPARKKYMKTIQTEFSLICEIITKYCLANPKVNIQLIHNGKLTISSPCTTNTVNNIAAVYGKDVARHLIPVNYGDSIIEVMGLVSKPSLTKSDKGFISVFINNRYVKSKLLTDAVIDAYNTLLNVGKYPIAVVNVKIDPKKIDVNVHPAKTVVKIADESTIYSKLFDAVRKTFEENELIEPVREEDSQTMIVSDKVVKPEPKEEKYAFTQDKQAVLEASSDVEIKTSKIPEVKLLGQFNKTYFLGEGKDSLYIIDQHALHERIMYEKLMNEKSKDGIKIQELLEPELLDLDPKQTELLKEKIEFLGKLGFKIEEFGQNSFRLRTVPSLFGITQTATLLNDILAEIEEVREKNAADEIIEKKLIRAACRSVIKAGDEFSNKQMRELLNELDKCKQPYTCPHGRPTIIKYSFKDIEKRFRRVV